MIKLIPSVKSPLTWRAHDPRAAKADSDFRRVRPLILRRDRYTCQGCGAQPKNRLEVHHLDNNHHNNRMGNLISVCKYCHAVFHSGFHNQANPNDKEPKEGGPIPSVWWLSDNPVKKNTQARISLWALGAAAQPDIPPGRWMTRNESGDFITHLMWLATNAHPNPEEAEELRSCALWFPTALLVPTPT